MRIKKGGSIEILNSKEKIETIKIVAQAMSHSFEFWINEDCLSYLTIEELLQLKSEIQEQLEISIGVQK